MCALCERICINPPNMSMQQGFIRNAVEKQTTVAEFFVKIINKTLKHYMQFT